MTRSIHPFYGALLSIAAVAAPATLASSSTAGTAQTLPNPLPNLLPNPLPQPALDAALPLPAAPDAPVAVETAAPDPDPRHVECVAKVILHEAAYEPRPGRIAVAQVIRARIRDGRFAGDACGVTRQRGQFFNVDAFQPARDAAWADAVAIAAETLAGQGEELVPGALFFHATFSPMPGHRRVGQIGGHIFYR